MTIREMIINLDSGQIALANSFLNPTPILDMLPFEPASHGLKNIFTKLDSADIIGKKNFDGGLNEVSASFSQTEKDLSLYGAVLKVASDTAKKMGGADKYFARQLPSILQNTGIAYETDTLRNEILGASKKSNKDVSVGSGNEYMVAMEWVQGINTMLYDPNMYGKGVIFDIAKINGGNEYEISNTNGQVFLGYGLALRSNFGVQIADTRKISSISGLDLSQSLPADLDDKIDAMIDEARLGNNGVIYMSPKLLTKISKYKTDKLVTNVIDSNLNRRIALWNGIRIITSYNL